MAFGGRCLVFLALALGGCFDETTPAVDDDSETGGTDPSGASTATPPTTGTDPTTPTGGTTDPGGCPPAADDCDGDPSNGCETDIDADRLNCGSCGNECDVAVACVGGVCSASCSGGVIHVAPTGDDTFDGCTPETPKATISAAIDKASAGALADHEIHVCEGTFTENVVLDYPISLRGSYSCATWARTDDFWDDEQNITSVLADAGNRPSLGIIGAAVDRDVLIDGLFVLGPSTPQFSIAISVGEGAAPEMRQLIAFGGTGTNQGSVALVVDTDAAPWVHDAALNGGGEIEDVPQNANSSLALWLNTEAGAARIEGNAIYGGSARGGVGSVGLLVQSSANMTGNAAIESNFIHGGNGSCAGAALCDSTIGVLLNGTGEVELRANSIIGGEAECENADPLNARCTQTGIIAAPSAVAIIDANQIYGGEALDPVMQVRAMRYAAHTNGRVSNNFIHAGRVPVDAQGDYVAILLDESPDIAFVANNTIASATMGAADGESIAIQLGAGRIELENNLFVGSAGADMAIRVDACTHSSPDPLDSLRSNAFVNFGLDIVQVWRQTVTCGPVQTGDTVTTAIAALNSLGGMLEIDADNILFGDCVDGDAYCEAFANCPGNGCRETFFDVWTGDGVTQLITGGWNLADLPACSLVERGVDHTGIIDLDSFGNVRMPPVSIGAEEFNELCAAPPG